MLKVVQRHNCLFGACIVFLLAILLLAVGSTVNLAHAANSASMNANVTIKSSLTLNIPTNTIVMNLDPSTHDFDEQDLTITVGTNNFNGYKLYANANSTNLVNTADSTKTIPNLASSTSPSSFPANNWGYRVAQDSSSSSGNYGQFVSGSVVSQSTGPVNNKTATVGLAAKVDYTKPSGLYRLNLEFKALPIVTQYYMQDLTSSLATTICTEEPTVVIDKRDEQPYLIQRLDDGRCWMLDNLNLDLTNAVTVSMLSTSNTNADAASLKSLKEGNRSAGAQYATAGLTLSNWGNTSSSYTQPLVNISGTCGTSSTYPCSYNGAYTNNSVMPNSTGVGLGSHKVGVYYNFCAATAGSYCYESSGASSGGATYDICPANWKLPTGAASGEWQGLCDAVNGGSCGSSIAMTDTSPNSMQYKLSVTYGGNYGGSDISGAVTRQGNYGFYWASNATSEPTRVGGIHLTQSNGTISAQASLARWGANSIRCILKES